MTNREKYAEEIKNFRGDFCEEFILPKILKATGCGNISCAQCRMLQMSWLDEEYKEPEVDWSKVPVDTKIYVRNKDGDCWLKRYFAEANDGTVYSFIQGRTSWTSNGEKTCWNQAKLAEEEK